MKHKYRLLSSSLVLLVAFIPMANGVYDPNDEHHRLVSQVKIDFSEEIDARQARLRTRYHAVALVDVARERLESGVLAPSEPNWSQVIRYALLGYGYSKGVDSSAQASAAEIAILKAGYSISSAYYFARGDATPVLVSQVYTESSPVSAINAHVRALNLVAATVPAQVQARVRARVQDISRLTFVIDSLSVGVESGHRSLIIDAVEAIPKDKHTPEFAAVCRTLSDGMNGFDKAAVVRVVAKKVLPGSYQIFKDTCNGIAVGMSGHDKSQVVGTVAGVPVDKYTPAFVTTCRGLFVGSIGMKLRIISRVGWITVDKYTPAFVETCNRLSVGLDGLKKLSVINAVGTLLAVKYQSFKALYLALSTEMDEKAKISLLGLLADLLATKDAAEIMTDCTRSCAGKLGVYKLEAIENYANDIR